MTPKALFAVPAAALAALLFSQAVAAGLADMPKRKSGLWDVKSQMEGKPVHQGFQVCIDANTDDVMRARAGKAQPQCSVMDVKRQGGKVLVHSVCQIERTTATTDAVITGSFESGYRNDMTVRYDPPMMGMGTVKMTSEGKWLGPCKPGQKPGDVIMAGRGTVNIQDSERQRQQIEEMMKKRRAQ